MYTREFISCNSCFIPTEFISFKTNLLAWLYWWFKIFTNTKYKTTFSFLILIDQNKIISLDLIRHSHINSKATISSVLGSEYTEPAHEEEKQLRNGGIVQNVNSMYEDLDDIENESIDDEYSSEESDNESEKDNSQVTFSPFCEKVTIKKELPTPLFAGKNFLLLFFFIW